jgi:hypothetical protein
MLASSIEVTKPQKRELFEEKACSRIHVGIEKKKGCGCGDIGRTRPEGRSSSVELHGAPAKLPGRAAVRG